MSREVKYHKSLFGRCSISAAALSLALVAAPAFASFDEFNHTVEDALKDDFYGQIKFDLRYRFEYVDQAGLGAGNADPLRLRLGWLSPEFVSGFQAFIEFEGLTHVFANQYNSTRNGKTQFPVIADPSVAELNRFWLSFNGIPDTLLKVGRQRIRYDNQRFLGNVGWRQLEQTFDSFTLANNSIENLDVQAGYLWNVLNVTGRNVGVRAPILNVSYDVKDYGKLTGYGYWLGYTTSFNSGPTPYAFATQTYGLRFNGGTKIVDNLKALYTAEYAFQMDYDKNPRKYTVHYFDVMGGLQVPELGAGFSNLVAKVGWSQLGSSGGSAFQTPLGTNHKFQGWADKFLVTPPQGIQDLNAEVGFKFYGIKMAAIYHNFRSAVGGVEYGNEVDAVIARKFGKHYTVLAKYAQYYAKNFATDTQKFWLSVETKF